MSSRNQAGGAEADRSRAIDCPSYERRRAIKERDRSARQSGLRSYGSGKRYGTIKRRRVIAGDQRNYTVGLGNCLRKGCTGCAVEVLIPAVGGSDAVRPRSQICGAKGGQAV